MAKPTTTQKRVTSQEYKAKGPPRTKGPNPYIPALPKDPNKKKRTSGGPKAW